MPKLLTTAELDAIEAGCSDLDDLMEKVREFDLAWVIATAREAIRLREFVERVSRSATFEDRIIIEDPDGYEFCDIAAEARKLLREGT